MKTLLALFFLAPLPLSAATAFVTTLQNGVTVNATVTGDLNTLASTGNWFIFTGTAGSLVDIDINRLAAPPDMVASLYFGDVTGVDVDSLVSPGTTINDDIMWDTFPGPLAFLENQDDTESDAFGGPFGDPRFNLILPYTGTYSLLVTAFAAGTSDGNPVGQPFEITLTGADISAVPEPGNFFALAALLAAGTFFRNRRR